MGWWSDQLGRHCERSEAIHVAASRKVDYFVAPLLAMTKAPYADFSNSSRPISMRRISLVPAPIS
jgi:hypothetical protein